MSNNEINVECGIINELKDQIVENTIFDNITIDAEDSMELVYYSRKLMKGKKFSLLVNTGRNITVTKDAWTIFNHKKNEEHLLFKAIVIKSPLYYFLSEVYYSINKPNIKTKIFTDRDQAIDWLEKKMKK
ncbi:MAG: hypothetical protein ACON4M_08485 [Crocinitomicaceae bacterium]